MTDDIGEVGAELRRAVSRLYSRFRSERADGEVSDAALLVLMVLSKRGELSLSELAAAAHVTLGSMSQTMRRLEQSEFVAKSRGTADRRTVIFRLTEHGAAAATASRLHREDWLNGRLAELTPAERASIAHVAPLLLRLADS
ncbi:MarR family winged helix-turn-helix transcriptional regulator [Leifsonia sp. NPDC058194]|uniref:MarR family winged helix-turn-helix transcriptional regulator n=1 Tax=Leifsonia sp. NPDC058194 TaxID=3346374 RepID=UPI0036DE5D3A